VPRNDLIQLRSDTAANWASVNPILAVGETGFETDTGKLKVGIGSTDWNSLIYVTDASDLAGVIPSARISGSYTGITGVGALTAGTWNASVVAGQYGGTGVANTGKTITLGGNLTTSGAFTTTLTVGANTSLTLPSSGTVISTGNLSSITSTGTLTGLTLSGTVTLPNSVNNQIYTSTTADSALPWANGPVLQGATGWSFYSAISASYRMGFRSNTTGTTKYFWTADSALIGQAPADVEITNTLNVMGTGRFTGTVTAPTFSGALSGNATTSTKAGSLGAGGVSGTAMTFNWSGQGGQPTWLWGGNDGSNMYVYNPSNFSVSSAGASNVTTFTSTIINGTTSSNVADHSGMALRGGSGGTIAGMSLWASSVAPQFRVAANANDVYLRNANDSVYCTFYAIISNQSSVHDKQDIESFPQIVKSASAAVNENELLTGLNVVRQLRPVNYRWKEELHFAQLPSNPRRAMALSRLNAIRSSKGLEPYQSDELQHDCSRDKCSGTAENPCKWTKNWENGYIGFIAQEVGAVVPQAANIDDSGEYSSLDNMALTAIAVASIKELDATIQTLTERIKQLEESNV
jgi:hypothetical protein